MKDVAEEKTVGGMRAKLEAALCRHAARVPLISSMGMI